MSGLQLPEGTRADDLVNTTNLTKVVNTILNVLRAHGSSLEKLEDEQVKTNQMARRVQEMDEHISRLQAKQSEFERTIAEVGAVAHRADTCSIKCEQGLKQQESKLNEAFSNILRVDGQVKELGERLLKNSQQIQDVSLRMESKLGEIEGKYEKLHAEQIRQAEELTAQRVVALEENSRRTEENSQLWEAITQDKQDTQSELATIKKDSNQLSNKVSDLKSELDRHSGKIKAMEDSNVDRNVQLETLRKKFNELDNHNQALETRSLQIQQDISGLNSYVGQVREDLHQLHNDSAQRTQDSLKLLSQRISQQEESTLNLRRAVEEGESRLGREIENLSTKLHELRGYTQEGIAELRSYSEEHVQSIRSTVNSVAHSCEVLHTFTAQLGSEIAALKNDLLKETAQANERHANTLDDLENWYEFLGLSREQIGQSNRDGNQVDALHSTRHFNPLVETIVVLQEDVNTLKSSSSQMRVDLRRQQEEDIAGVKGELGAMAEFCRQIEDVLNTKVGAEAFNSVNDIRNQMSELRTKVSETLREMHAARAETDQLVVTLLTEVRAELDQGRQDADKAKQEREQLKSDVESAWQEWAEQGAHKADILALSRRAETSQKSLEEMETHLLELLNTQQSLKTWCEQLEDAMGEIRQVLATPFMATIAPPIARSSSRASDTHTDSHPNPPDTPTPSTASAPLYGSYTTTDKTTRLSRYSLNRGTSGLRSRSLTTTGITARSTIPRALGRDALSPQSLESPSPASSRYVQEVKTTHTRHSSERQP